MADGGGIPSIPFPNHREIMGEFRHNDGRPAQMAFMDLPVDLQDEIIEGLDQCAITTANASAMVKEAGYSLSGESIRRYYAILKTQRSFWEFGHIVKTVMQYYSEIDSKTALTALLNMVTTTLLNGIANGSIEFKAVDPAKLIDCLAGLTETLKGLKKPGMGAPLNITPEKKKQIREEIYGL